MPLVLALYECLHAFHGEWVCKYLDLKGFVACKRQCRPRDIFIVYPWRCYIVLSIILLVFSILLFRWKPLCSNLSNLICHIWKLKLTQPIASFPIPDTHSLSHLLPLSCSLHAVNLYVKRSHWLLRNLKRLSGTKYAGLIHRSWVESESVKLRGA